MSIETFNLAAPPNFRGLDPAKPVKIYQRNLPHWRRQGATYFVTFRLGDALPHEKLEFLKRLYEEWKRIRLNLPSTTAREEFAAKVFRQVETWLDEGHGACHFQNPQFAAPLQETLLHFHNKRYFVGCSVIMPNHCHMVIHPYADHPLEKILQGIKGVSAHRINSLIGSSGNLWQDETYDRIVRDEEHLWRIVQYIGRNPIKIGLPDHASRRWISPEWVAAGWDFIDE